VGVFYFFRFVLIQFAIEQPAFDRFLQVLRKQYKSETQRDRADRRTDRNDIDGPDKGRNHVPKCVCQKSRDELGSLARNVIANTRGRSHFADDGYDLEPEKRDNIAAGVQTAAADPPDLSYIALEPALGLAWQGARVAYRVATDFTGRAHALAYALAQWRFSFCRVL